MTVSKAFGMLEDEGVLTRRRGRAMVISDQHRLGLPESERLRHLQPTLEVAAQEAHQLCVRPVDAFRLFRNILS